MRAAFCDLLLYLSKRLPGAIHFGEHGHDEGGGAKDSCSVVAQGLCDLQHIVVRHWTRIRLVRRIGFALVPDDALRAKAG